jgi:hypothetical protein
MARQQTVAIVMYQKADSFGKVIFDIFYSASDRHQDTQILRLDGSLQPSSKPPMTKDSLGTPGIGLFGTVLVTTGRR